MDPFAAPTPAPAGPPRLPRRREPWMAVLLGLVVPGLGHVYAGRPLKAALHLLAILGLFGLGVALTGWTAVSPRRHPLEFAAHVWMGLPAIVAWQHGETIFLEHVPRWMEIGRLFAAIGGLLNVVAACDALGEVVGHNVRVEAARRAALPPPPLEVGALSTAEANGQAPPLAAEETRSDLVPSGPPEADATRLPPEPSGPAPLEVMDVEAPEDGPEAEEEEERTAPGEDAP